MSRALICRTTSVESSAYGMPSARAIRLLDPTAGADIVTSRASKVVKG
jgi:hypothetical protein